MAKNMKIKQKFSTSALEIAGNFKNTFYRDVSKQHTKMALASRALRFKKCRQVEYYRFPNSPLLIENIHG